jgi:sugar phosphate isomerase/epimerase
VKLVFFSKALNDKDIPGLIETAHELGVDGYDLAVRDGYTVSPDNASEMFPVLMKGFAREGLCVPMVTGPTDLVNHTHPAAEPLMSAMGDNDVRLLKLGYVLCDPKKGESYWQKVGELRKELEGWAKLAETYGVKVCYHTHSGPYLGLNCSALMHLLQGFDPKHIGAFIDPGHMTIDGEPYALGIDMVREYLSIVALKDVLFIRDDHGDEGGHGRKFVPAGEGAVRWSEVFAELVRVGFTGPISIHAEYKVDTQEEFWSRLKPEVEYFKKKREAALKGA